MNCREYAKNIDLSVNNGMEFESRKRFEMHLNECPDCAMEYSAIHSIQTYFTNNPINELTHEDGEKLHNIIVEKCFEEKSPTFYFSDIIEWFFSSTMSMKAAVSCMIIVAFAWSFIMIHDIRPSDSHTSGHEPVVSENRDLEYIYNFKPFYAASEESFVNVFVHISSDLLNGDSK